MSTDPSRDEVERWLSPYRYRPYLQAANNDHAAAMALYDWNVAMSAAFLEVIARFEVVLRNGVDAVLKELEVPPSARRRRRDGWWFADRTFLDAAEVATSNTAIDRLSPQDAQMRDKVLSQLPFGFWARMFSSDYDELFKHHLVKVFPHRPDGGFTRKVVSTTLEQVRQVRNNAAHHQPLYRLNLDDVYERVLDLIEYIDPRARQWIEDTSRIVVLSAQRPAAAPPTAVVVAANNAWPLYLEVGAYVCQPGRFFQPVSHIAFYQEGAIKRQVAKIQDVQDDVSWTPQDIGRLKSTGDPRDSRLADVIKASRAAVWTKSDRYKVFLLTSADSEPSTGHVILPGEIAHKGSGKGSAYVQRQRYATVDALVRARQTSDLPPWR